MTINNESERNYQGKCLGSPVTSYGGALLFAFHRGITGNITGVMAERV